LDNILRRHHFSATHNKAMPFYIGFYGRGYPNMGNVSCENELHPANLKICVRPVRLDTNGQISCSVSTILRFAENPLMSILFLSRPYSIGHQYRTSRSPSSPPLSSPFPISDRAGKHHGYGAPPSLVQHVRSRAR
jgi:hypothetical protein